VKRSKIDQTQPYLRGGPSGRTLANPCFYNFVWPDYERALQEQQRLHGQYREYSAELSACEEEIKGLEGQEIFGLAGAMIEGVEPEHDPARLLEARSRRDDLEKRVKAAGLALGQANTKVYAALNAKREGYLEEVAGRKLEAHGKVLESLEGVKAAFAELFAMHTLEEWIERPNRNFSPAAGPTELTTFANGRIPVNEVFEGLERCGRELVEENVHLDGYVLQKGEAR
jgi:hypothetical protein